ncbi:MAG TPA: hypothetical protein VGN31_06810, partial [Paraburkholderia sp.]
MPGRPPNAGIAPRAPQSAPEQGAAGVNALICAFASVLQGAAGSAIEVRLGLADSVDRVGIDPTQFKMALLNLV